MQLQLLATTLEPMRHRDPLAASRRKAAAAESQETSPCMKTPPAVNIISPVKTSVSESPVKAVLTPREDIVKSNDSPTKFLANDVSVKENTHV